MVQRNLTPGGDKNGADINLALDALEMAITHPHINAFVIVGGDSDFISLVEKLKQYDKKVFVVGGQQFTSGIMQRNCHEFIAYENLLGASSGRRHAERGVRVERVPIEQAIPLVTRGLKVLADREVSPQLGLLKSTLLQLDSTFSERSYGAGSFRDFVEKLEKIGLVHLKEVKGSLLVTATEAVDDVQTPVDGTEGQDGAAASNGTPSNGASTNGATNGATNGGSSRDGDGENGAARDSLVAVVGSQVEGLQEFKRILATGEVRRWPMYLRNVKQLIRQVSAEFDERAYGFANLVDLLRAAARDNLVRVDRDRQGVIRVFQGAVPSEAPARKIFDIEDELAEEAARGAAEGAAPDAKPESDSASDESAVEGDEETQPAEAHLGATEEDVAVTGGESAPVAAFAAEAVREPVPARPEFETDEDPNEPNFNRPGAGGEDGELAPARTRRAASTRRSTSGAAAGAGRATTRTRTTTRPAKTTAARAARTPRPRKTAKKS